MPWTDQPGPRPHRSPDELLAVVQRRAAVIRRNRRTRVPAGLGGFAVVLLAATALARGEDGDSELRVVGTVTTSVVTSTTAPELLATTTTLSPPPPPSSIRLRPSTQPPTTRTTLPRSPATTASPPTTSPPATTTTTEPPPLRACGPSDVVVTATPDRASYPRGAAVIVVVAAQNRSSSACQPLDPSVEFHDGAGNHLSTAMVADAFTMSVPGEPRPAWDPGETLSLPMGGPPYCGDTTPCPPGTYTATAVFGPFRSPAAAFAIT